LNGKAWGTSKSLDLKTKEAAWGTWRSPVDEWQIKTKFLSMFGQIPQFPIREM